MCMINVTNVWKSNIRFHNYICCASIDMRCSLYAQSDRHFNRLSRGWYGILSIVALSCVVCMQGSEQGILWSSKWTTPITGRRSRRSWTYSVATFRNHNLCSHIFFLVIREFSFVPVMTNLPVMPSVYFVNRKWLALYRSSFIDSNSIVPCLAPSWFIQTSIIHTTHCSISKKNLYCIKKAFSDVQVTETILTLESSPERWSHGQNLSTRD